jgi:hypothetical protein
MIGTLLSRIVSKLDRGHGLRIEGRAVADPLTAVWHARVLLASTDARVNGRPSSPLMCPASGPSSAHEEAASVAA